MKNTNNERYVVLINKVGRMKAGIHHKVVHVIGAKAYVVNGDSSATVVPKNCTFDTLKAAQTYVAGEGKLCWVAQKGEGHRGKRRVDVFEAWVKETYSYVYGHGSPHNWYRLIMKKGCRVAEKDRWYDATKLFDSKAEAQARALVWVVEELEETEKMVKSWTSARSELLTLQKEFS